MSKPQKNLPPRSRVEDRPGHRPALILEKQLMDTLELCRCVQQARICSIGARSIKMRSLFDGMLCELQVFSEKIRKRLESWRRVDSRVARINESSYSRLFVTGDINVHDQFEALLCGYARYERQTLAAKVSLERSGDLESSQLLAAILKAVERCFWFLEIYLEGLAVNADMTRLPDWQATSR